MSALGARGLSGAARASTSAAAAGCSLPTADAWHPHLRGARTLALQGLPRGAASGRLERGLVHCPQAAQRA